MEHNCNYNYNNNFSDEDNYFLSNEDYSDLSFCLQEAHPNDLSHADNYSMLPEEHGHQAIEEEAKNELQNPQFNSNIEADSSMVPFSYGTMPLNNMSTTNEVATMKPKPGRGGPRRGAGAKPKKKEVVKLDPDTAVGAACASFARFVYIGEVSKEEKEMFEEYVTFIADLVTYSSFSRKG
jgi:hypothetical protein